MRKALKHDCERYNAVVVAGWLVVRFAYEDVMFEAAYVRRVLVGAVELLSGEPLGRALDGPEERRSA